MDEWKGLTRNHFRAPAMLSACETESVDSVENTALLHLSANMKILTWNINGIRASKVPLNQLFQSLDADIICLQETKVTRDQLDEPSAIVDGYNAYFSFSKVRSGYSGVATFARDSATPHKAEAGLTGLLANQNAEDNIGYYGDQSDFTDEELQSLDNEGRAVITQHKFLSHDGKTEDLTIINVYCPRADPEKEERKNFKVRFYQLLQARAEALFHSGSHVIVLGDVNTSHKTIDQCDPSEPSEFLSNPGRRWLNQFLYDPEVADPLIAELSTPQSPSKELQPKTGRQFIDTFRHFHPQQLNAYTCWQTLTGARATNYGTRIDYIFADLDLTKHTVKDCNIMLEVEGSDHCPVRASFDVQPLPAKKCPSICTKWLPEFLGKQQKLSAFFTKIKPAQESTTVQTLNNKGPQLSQQGSLQASKPVVIKRSASNSPKRPLKKQRTDERSVSKQGSLLNFFTKSTAKAGAKAVAASSSLPSSQDTDSCSSSSQSQLSDDIKPPSQPKQAAAAASSWKNLLKGPPQAPPCKGHKEPCVLRTVKKEGPNKGKQFWVCTRPEGHKTNKEARCEHFEWVSKKR